VIGTILNVAGIAAGGVAGLVRQTPPAPATQQFFKAALGLSTVICGLAIAATSFHGSFRQVLKQLAIVLAALILGKLAGRLLRLQKLSNRLGQSARARVTAAKPDDPARFTHGFVTCSILLCAAPLGIVGAVQDGLSGYPYALAIKAVLDGLAVMGFVSMFGGGVILSAVPVLVFQGTITLLCARFLQPALGAALLDATNATGGFLVFCVALVIFEIRRIELADYLPSLAAAPLLTWALGG
jgi:uncharacterized protein